MEGNALLELDDIQSGVLRPRPTPYVATYIGLRIDDGNAGRELMRRVSTVVSSAANPTSPLAENWESPLGTGDIHVVLVAVSPSNQQLEAVLDPARKAYREMPGVEAIWRQD